MNKSCYGVSFEESVIGGAHRGLGSVRVRDGATEREGRAVHVHGQFAEGAGADCGACAGSVPEHRGVDVFAAVQAGVLAGGEPRDGGCDQRRRPGPALDWHDGAEAGEMDVCALAGAEDPVPCGHGRRGVRLLRGNGEVCLALVERYGLEWLYRLLMEPRRMWRRYVVGNVKRKRKMCLIL